MNERRPTTIEQAVGDYFAAEALPDDRLRALARMRSPRPPWFWVAVGALGATAALVAASMVLPPSGGRSGTRSTASVAGLAAPGLVAVQIRADWCPRTPQVTPLFGELLAQHGNKPVLFVSFDITDDVRREQAERLAASLGIERALEAPFGSGMIKLFDRERDVLLATVTGPDDYPEFELQLAAHLRGP